MQFASKYDIKILKSLRKQIESVSALSENWPKVVKDNRDSILAALTHAIDTSEVAICHGGIATLVDQSSAVQRDLFSTQSTSIQST